MSTNDRLVSELSAVLSELSLDFLGGEHELVAKIHTSCAGLRRHLHSEEREDDIVPLTEAASYWDLTPKYRYDLLAFDIPNLANQLAFSVGLGTVHVDHVAKTGGGYFPTWSDVLFWYHVDFGVRLASSSWDRTALLLDLAFGLNCGAGCNLPTVLRRLPEEDPDIVHRGCFKRLKQFRDGRFTELEAGRGSGARHEATHLLSPSTRYLAEFVESFSRENARTEASDWRQFLREHHGIYLEGLKDALRLVEERWPVEVVDTQQPAGAASEKRPGEA